MSVWKSDGKQLIFTSLISPSKILLFGISIKHSTQCFISRWKTSKFVKNTPLCVVFLTLFSVFRLLMKLRHMLDILHETGFTHERFFTSYFINHRVFFRIFTFYIVFDDLFLNWFSRRVRNNWKYVGGCRLCACINTQKFVMNMAHHFNHRWK